MVALLALIPVAAYGIVQAEVLAAVAGINVVIVTISLFIAFETIEEARTNDAVHS